jgi:hypothetical protein
VWAQRAGSTTGDRVWAQRADTADRGAAQQADSTVADRGAAQQADSTVADRGAAQQADSTVADRGAAQQADSMTSDREKGGLLRAVPWLPQWQQMPRRAPGLRVTRRRRGLAVVVASHEPQRLLRLGGSSYVCSLRTRMNQITIDANSIEPTVTLCPCETFHETTYKYRELCRFDLR